VKSSQNFQTLIHPPPLSVSVCFNTLCPLSLSISLLVHCLLVSTCKGSSCPFVRTNKIVICSFTYVFLGHPQIPMMLYSSHVSHLLPRGISQLPPGLNNCWEETLQPTQSSQQINLHVNKMFMLKLKQC
jgi:hypothetical protein